MEGIITFMIALALAAILAADHHYIIPLIGNSYGIPASHLATATMLNPTSRPATVRRTGLYPADCTKMTQSWLLAPHSSVEVAWPYDSNCHGTLAALTVVSDEPLYIRGSILTHGFMPAWIMDTQEYDAPTAWIEAGVEAVTSGVTIDGGHRTNLLVINPNPEPLQVEVHVYRSEFDAFRTDAFEVPPATLRLFPIAPVANPDPPTGEPIAVTGHHDIVVKANGRFQAGASSVNTYGGNVFRKAIPLEP